MQISKTLKTNSIEQNKIYLEVGLFVGCGLGYQIAPHFFPNNPDCITGNYLVRCVC